MRHNFGDQSGSSSRNYSLAKNMETAIAMLEKHYSHLEVIHKAELLVGRAEGTKRKRRQETNIIILENENQQKLLLEPYANVKMERSIKNGCKY
ncbi:MAG: hypothetical protein GYA55_10950 [SAR324 cluster bacterium]|uniref:Uncharacterized protein n=1 Tax=SAR324 cluster bacterium TaxID=2024889 RepID=A0A7X9FSU8_9DELT|nr:hypothetical protein [SAR324 cluster bacterium]